ncbi:MAG: pheromone autoinducer 2 transporter [Firmicutes bacterium ADurb.Bin193]|nr:MAG: pheromone autoinducer 2 transporter [Firmicutes bacterium ADurb.Bin193]
MPENKHLRFLLIVAYAVIGYFFVTKILPYIIEIFLPFILAMLVAAITRPLVVMFKKIRFPNLLASLLSLVIVLAVVCGIIFALVNRLVTEITQLSKQLPSLLASLPETLGGVMQKWYAFSEGLSPEMSANINTALQSFASSLSSLAMPATQKVVNIATVLASSLPYILIFTVAFLFSCIFFTKDYEYIKQNIARQFPKTVLAKLMEVKSYAFTAFGKYIKGMSIILCVTFIELFTGFLILNIQYAFLVALAIALLDALPAAGTGIVLIPWSLIELISGNYKMAISLFALYIIILVVRQLIEPKIMSSSFGTYPVITLIGMYAGLKLFGVVGLVVMPILLTILVYMQRAGLFTFWKTAEDKVNPTKK